MITQEQIKSLAYYSKETGGLHWLINTGKCKPNDRCGYKHSRGYRHVLMLGNNYKEHVLIWIYHNGEIPFGMQIDHEKQIRDLNFIWNLRLVTGFQNQQNRGVNKNNKSGYKGVSLLKSMGKYSSEIMANRIKYRLGYFDTPEQAALAYNKAAVKLHKEFANLNILKRCA